MPQACPLLHRNINRKNFAFTTNCTNFALLFKREQMRIVLWCNGSTTGFGSVCPGSNPGRTTKKSVLRTDFFICTSATRASLHVCNHFQSIFHPQTLLITKSTIRHSGISCIESILGILQGLHISRIKHLQFIRSQVL